MCSVAEKKKNTPARCGKPFNAWDKINCQEGQLKQVSQLDLEREW